MDKDRNSDIGLKVVKTPILGNCVCPTCGMKQPFVKDHEHWKKVKDLSLDKSTLLSVQRISAKCLNLLPVRERVLFSPVCYRQAIHGIERYQRVALRVKREALDKNILDNMPYHRLSLKFKPSQLFWK